MALVLIARFVEPVEGPEGVLPTLGRNAGPVIVDVDR